jgi:hypothetical protein
MAQSMYASSGFPMAAALLPIERMPEPFGLPSAITKYPWEAISPNTAAFDNPFC